MSEASEFSPSPSTSASPSLSISIVAYFSDPAWLTTTLASLVAALGHARHAAALQRARIYLIDNQAESGASTFAVRLNEACSAITWIDKEIIAGQGNVGFGRANNLAISRCPDFDFHLILNPDVNLAEDALTNALRYLQRHAACGMVSPIATSPNGQPLYLVKRKPDFFTLALRGFAPAWIRKYFRSRLDAYERRETPFDSELSDVQIASGCFMLIRRAALDRTGGFDPAYFLYFEDFDLSFRVSKFAGIARVADVRIVHAGGSAAAKGLRHVWLFARSALRFHRKLRQPLRTNRTD